MFVFEKKCKSKLCQTWGREYSTPAPRCPLYSQGGSSPGETGGVGGSGVSGTFMRFSLVFFRKRSYFCKFLVKLSLQMAPNKTILWLLASNKSLLIYQETGPVRYQTCIQNGFNHIRTFPKTDPFLYSRSLRRFRVFNQPLVPGGSRGSSRLGSAGGG